MVQGENCARCGAVIPPGAAVRGMCPRCLLVLGLEPEVEEWDGGEARPPAPEELAALLPGYEVGELLGRGGMGFVYRARQRNLDRPVALKLLSAAAGRDPAFAERFEREARTLARLDHPGIVRVFEFGRAGVHHYLAMELVDGVDLRELIRTRELAPRQALEIVMQVCDALQYAHDEGVVHRDIKPGNVLIDRKGRVKVADFGLAKILRAAPGGPALTLTGVVMGTPQYMAPEQYERPLEVDHRADIYALGVLLYEVLTGELPVGRFDPPSRRVGVDVRLDEVVLRALERAPERRYQQASEVRTDVQRISGSEPQGTGEASPVVARSVVAPAEGRAREALPSHGRRPVLGWLLCCGCLVPFLALLLMVLLATPVIDPPEFLILPSAPTVPALPGDGASSVVDAARRFLGALEEPARSEGLLLVELEARATGRIGAVLWLEDLDRDSHAEHEHVAAALQRALPSAVVIRSEPESPEPVVRVSLEGPPGPSETQRSRPIGADDEEALDTLAGNQRIGTLAFTRREGALDLAPSDPTQPLPRESILDFLEAIGPGELGDEPERAPFGPPAMKLTRLLLAPAEGGGIQPGAALGWTFEATVEGLR